MKKIAIISRKGGAGKTTIALHLAVAAEERGLVTVVFDLDPQASAALWKDKRENTVPAVVPAQAPRLAQLLGQASRQNVDLVLMDTAPHADAIASEAANYANFVLIPCRPSSLDLDAVGASIRLARSANVPAAIVINAAPVQGTETQEAITALAHAGVEVCPVVLHQRKPFANRLHEGLTAIETDPKGKAASEITLLLSWLCNKLELLPRQISR